MSKKREISEIFGKLASEMLPDILPGGDVFIGLIELIKNTVEPEQVAAITDWMINRQENSLRVGPRDISIQQIAYELHEQLFKPTNRNNRSRTHSTPYSVVIGKKLVQWYPPATRNDQLFLAENEGHGRLRPDKVTKYLTISSSNQWATVTEDGQQVLTPTSNATTQTITLSQEHLSTWFLTGLKLNTATYQSNSNGEDEPSQLSSWPDALAMIKGLTTLSL